jgi:hypothetical protein
MNLKHFENRMIDEFEMFYQGQYFEHEKATNFLYSGFIHVYPKLKDEITLDDLKIFQSVSIEYMGYSLNIIFSDKIYNLLSKYYPEALI